MLIYRTLTKIDQQYFHAGLDILNRTQGRDLFSSTFLDEQTNSKLALVVGAFDESELVGLGVAKLINDFTYYLPFDFNICQELQTKTVGSFSTLAVHENYRGQGVGQTLSRLRLQWLHDQRCEVILGVSWVSGLPHTSDRVFEKMGFTAVETVQNFYRNISIENPFHCPGCNANPCTCSAVLYRLNLWNSSGGLHKGIE